MSGASLLHINFIILLFFTKKEEKIKILVARRRSALVRDPRSGGRAPVDRLERFIFICAASRRRTTAVSCPCKIFIFI